MVLPSCQLTNEPSRELLEGGRNEPNDVVMEPPSLHGGEGGGGTGIKMGRNSICFQCDSAERQNSPTKKLKAAWIINLFAKVDSAYLPLQIRITIIEIPI